MLRTRIRAGVLITGGAIAALLLTACNTGNSNDAANPDVPTIPNTSSSQTAPTSGQSQPTSTEQAGQPPAPAPATPASTECKVADLSLRLGGGDAAAGTSYRALVFTNKGGRTCTMQG